MAVDLLAGLDLGYRAERLVNEAIVVDQVRQLVRLRVQGLLPAGDHSHGILLNELLLVSSCEAWHIVVLRHHFFLLVSGKRRC
jgi:hypothetical protein